MAFLGGRITSFDEELKMMIPLTQANIILHSSIIMVNLFTKKVSTLQRY